MSKITFFCPSYNHEKYVKEFLDSLLAQTNPNWELLIFDDCSSDKTAEEIKSVHDERIHFFQNPYNKGMAYAVSKGIEMATTEFVAFTGSDDRFYPEYVETVLDTFQKNPEILACYTPLQYMNEQGQLLKSILSLPEGKNTEEIFADMFINENLLPSPGMAFKKSVMQKFLPFDVGMIQFTDYQMHFFLMYQHQIKLFEKPLVQYRVSEESACARSANVLIREEIETKKLMDTVVRLIGEDKEAFLKYFGAYTLIKENEIVSATIPYWLGRLALTSSVANKRKWGLQTIMDFIGVEENMALLHKLYGFSYKDYMGYAAIVNEKMSKLQKYKKKIKTMKKIIIGLIVLCLILGGCLWL